MDGTLVDSLGMWSDIDRRFFERYGMETPADYEKKINHMSFLEMAQFTKEEYQIPDSVETIMELWTEWSKEQYESEIQAKPGAQELLQFLKIVFILNRVSIQFENIIDIYFNTFYQNTILLIIIIK